MSVSKNMQSTNILKLVWYIIRNQLQSGRRC